ncbi:MAG: hypothetical protein D6704_08410 [Nitrospirae bacterium]|nr:MAG: hypothetical protein D6704_08410 [Nitrospirota bacterium]
MARGHATERLGTIFKTRQTHGEERWFVRVTCNVLGSRIYGPFAAQHEASRFRQGAEFELRKLLDCELPHLSTQFRKT